MKDSPLGAKYVALAGLFYLMVTILLSYPLAFSPSTLSRLDNADAQLNAWALSWVSHQTLRDPLRLFDANTFFPLPNSLAFSEHLFVPGILAMPILRLSDDLVLAFNVLLLLGMFVSAMGMYVLVADLTRNHTAALLSGMFFSFATYRFVRLPHIQMQIYGFLPLALACLHRYFRSGLQRWALAFAALFVVQALSGTYLAAITAMATGFSVVVLGGATEHRRQRWTGLLPALILAAAAIYPFVRPYLWVHRTLGVEWDLEGIGSMSATPLSYLASVSHLYRGLVGSVIPREAVTDFLFPGLSLLVLGGLGAWLLATRHGAFDQSRTNLLCYTGILVMGFAVSLGPRTPLYPVLYDYILFFRGLRALSRFGLLPLLSLSVLSGYTIAWLWNRIGSSGRRYGVALAVALLFIGETTVVPLTLTSFEDDPPEVYRWLRRDAEPGTIVELPYKRIDTRYMFWARHHGFRAMLNGDSGFIPQSHIWIREILLRFPSPDSLALLRSLDVRYVIVHLGAYRRDNRRLIRLLGDLDRYQDRLPTVANFGRDMVLKVAPSTTDTSFPVGGLPIEKMDTHWKAEGSVATVEVRLQEIKEVSGLRLHYGREPRAPVTGVSIEVLGPPDDWERIWESPEDWPALTELVLSLLEDPSDGKQGIRFGPVRARAFRIEMRGYGGTPEITKLELLGTTQ